MNIRPLHDRLVVKRIASSDSNVGGLFIPTAQKRSRKKEKLQRYPEANDWRAAAWLRWMYP